MIDSIKDGFNSLKDKAKEAYDYGENYKCFAYLFAIGVLFFIITLFTLPTFPVKPKTPALFFNLGMICMLISFGI